MRTFLVMLALAAPTCFPVQPTRAESCTTRCHYDSGGHNICVTRCR